MWLSAKETACKTGHVGLILESEDPLEKEMPIPSSIFVWELPWTEEPGRIQRRGSQNVRHDLETTVTTTTNE